MKTTPIITDITTDGLDHSEKAQETKGVWHTIMTGWLFGLGFTLFLFVMFIIIDLDSNPLVVFNAALFFGMLGAIGATIQTIRESRPDENLFLLQSLNNNRVATSSLPLDALHPNSVIAHVIRATTKDRDGRAITKGVRRNDGQGPLFFAGRFGIMESVYDEYLVLTVDLPRHCPQVLIDYDGSGSKGLTKFDHQLQGGQKFNLEGNFADTFTLYAATPNIARFATYVLTPDVMEQLMQLAPTADIEIVDDQLIVVWKTRQTSNTWDLTLPELFTTLNSIVAALYQRVSTYQHHTDTLLPEPLRFSFVTGAMHSARISLFSLQSDFGESVTFLRSWAAWLSAIGAFIIMAIVIIIQILLGLEPHGPDEL